MSTRRGPSLSAVDVIFVIASPGTADCHIQTSGISIFTTYPESVEVLFRKISNPRKALAEVMAGTIAEFVVA
jgi:hypothetical protein